MSKQIINILMIISGIHLCFGLLVKENKLFENPTL